MTTQLSNRQFLLLLSETPGLGQAGIRNVLEYCKTRGVSPDEFLGLSAEEKRSGPKLANVSANHLTRGLAAALERTEKLDHAARTHGIHVITFQDAAYPSRVESFISRPPSLFFAYGNLALLSQQCFCVLTSRHPTRDGLAAVEELTEKAIFERLTLATSHNKLGYQRSAVTALRWGAPRILVYDCGLMAAMNDDLTQEPFRIARLYRYRFDAATDLVISTSRLNDRYIGDKNQNRDELIVALSHRVYAAEISAGNVMHRMCARAMKEGRETLARPWLEYHDGNLGNRALLEAGAVAC